MACLPRRLRCRPATAWVVGSALMLSIYTMIVQEDAVEMLATACVFCGKHQG